MKKFLILLVLIVAFLHANTSVAQELLANVTIDATQVSDLQAATVADMKQTISRFLNDNKWSNDEFKTEERIRCNFAISLTGMPSLQSYQATLQVQATRPVYGTNYETILINYFDQSFNFELNVGQPIFFNENIYTSNLSAMLAFYANLILALDYDSFGKLSGQVYVEKAYNIAIISVEAGGGWVTSGDPNNRYAFIYNLNSQLAVPYRNQFYIYHRQALDVYLKDPAAAHTKVIEMLKVIKEINRAIPYSILLRTFFLSKRDELINMFRDSKSMDVKNEAYNLLRELDATNSEKYAAIIAR